MAANEASSVASLAELWAVLGMRREKDAEDEAVLAHIEQFLAYVQSHEARWRAAPQPAESSEGPALPPAALEQLASIGAQLCGGSAAHAAHRPVGRRERELAEAQRRAAEHAQHLGFPVLPTSRRLDGTMCYYCQRRFPSRMALFAHLRRVIDKDRFTEGHHQAHFSIKIVGGPAGLGSGPHNCSAANCDKTFATASELWQHYFEMGVPGFMQPPMCERPAPAAAAAAQASSQLREDTGPPEAAEVSDGGDLSLCSVCMDRPPDVVMVPCGHIYACEQCGKKLKECAICREPVTQVLRIYYSTN